MRRQVSKWFVVETESRGEVHFHYVFTRTAKSAASEAQARQFQSDGSTHEVKVNRVDMQV